MTENVTTVTGVGATLPSNTTIGADNISSVYYERVKIAQGDTGTAVDVSSGAPLWVNVATTGNILGTFTTSTGTIGAVLQGTSPWVTSPSSQWTVSVTPTSAIPVTGSFSLTSSTFVIGAVFPSTQWTVTTTPSSQINVTTTPSSQWTVSVTPTTQFSVTTTPSSVQTVATSSTTTVQGTVVTIPSSQAIVSVQPTTQWTVSVTPTSAISVTPSSIYQVSASAEVASMFNGTAALTPTFAPIAISSSGVSQVSSGITGKASYLINAYLVAAGAVNIQWCSSSTSLTYGGVTALSSNAGYVLPFSPVGWLNSTTTGGLFIFSSAPVQIGGGITYVSF